MAIIFSQFFIWRNFWKLEINLIFQSYLKDKNKKTLQKNG